MDVLSKKEVKKILRQLDKQFGVGSLDYVFVRSDKGKIFIVNKEFSDVDFTGFNINTIGLYVMKQEKDGIRLSIDGSQIIGLKAKKNVLVLEDFRDWMRGMNVNVDTKLKGYVIVKCGEDFLGCGRVVKGKLINYIPKARRVLELIS
jgi:NOL1/NOP2/fmu family ribosome biogenesis protein